MKFGKEFRIHLEETLPEWRDKFLCYKPLKKILKNISPAATTDALFPPSLRDIQAAAQPWIGIQEWFIGILDEELEKFNDFYIDKEEDFVIRLQELKERIERVKERSSQGGVLTSESEFSKEMLKICKDYVTIHGEMVLLKNYSSLNFAGLVKILKKYDKRTGELLRLPFTQRALHQPFFTTEPLTRLVRECEANLELLFPIEAEVVEPHPQNQTSTSDNTNANAPEASSIQEDGMDIYRGTLAAMRALQGLRKASSTYNPLSLASFFQSQDEDGTGDVTDVNSVSHSAALQNGESDQDDAHTNNR